MNYGSGTLVPHNWISQTVISKKENINKVEASLPEIITMKNKNSVVKNFFITEKDYHFIDASKMVKKNEVRDELKTAT